MIHEPWELVLSWADGPEAMASISRYALNKTATKPRRRVLLCSSPDTRPDADCPTHLSCDSHGTASRWFWRSRGGKSIRVNHGSFCRLCTPRLGMQG
ncbi:MAG: hypothetical protein NTV57_01535, partial [Cyanobacteria bacterium]|nr:hypothetical protein [Cyanobacteriota bacterium]